MAKTIVSCDTTIALSKQQIEELGLYVIPLNTIVDGVEYHDTVNINAETLAKYMRNGAKITTSTPTPTEIYDHFDKIIAKENPDYIIHFTISSKLSSMFDLFTNLCAEKYGDKVIVVDSLSICKWMLNQVLYARRLVEQGMEPHQVVEQVKKDLVGTEDAAFVPSSLEYLKRGGRISATAASIGNLIGIVPVLSFKDGVVEKRAITRTMRKAFITAIEEWKEKIPNLEKDYVMLILETDHNEKEKKEQAKELVKEMLPNIDIEESFMSLNVTAHAGPGTVGLGILKKI